MHMLTQLFVVVTVAFGSETPCYKQLYKDSLWYVVVNLVEPLLLPFVPVRDSPLLVCSEVGMELSYYFD